MCLKKHTELTSHINKCIPKVAVRFDMLNLSEIKLLAKF